MKITGEKKQNLPSKKKKNQTESQKKPQVKTTVSKQQNLPFEKHCKGMYYLELKCSHIFAETFIVLYFAFSTVLNHLK